MLVFLLVLVSAFTCFGADLHWVDAAMVYEDQIGGTYGVVRGNSFITVVNRQDCTGVWAVGDTVWAVVEIYEYAEGEFDWNDIKHAEGMAKARVTGDTLPTAGRLLWAFKANQNSPLVGMAEAERLSEHEFNPTYDDCFRWICQMYFSSRTDWHMTIFPFYQCLNNIVYCLFYVPQLCSHQRYLALYYYPTGLRFDGSDTLWIDTSFQRDCRWAFWYPDTTYGHYDPYPDEEEIEIVYPDSGTIGNYTISLDSLGLPPGTYGLIVKDFYGTVIRDLSDEIIPRSSLFQFQLSDEEVFYPADYLELTSDSAGMKIILGKPSQELIIGEDRR